MRSRNQSRTFLGLLVTVIAACVISPQRVIAQEESRIDRRIEQLKWIPPDPNLVRESDVKFALRMLRWRIQRGEMTQLHLQSEIKTIHAEIKHKENVVQDVVTENTPAQFRFATDAVREQLIGQVLQKLLNAELEILAHALLLEMLDDQPRSQRKQEQMRFHLRDEIFKARENALRQQLELLQQQLKNVEALAKGAAVSQLEVDEARVQVAKLEGELRELELERALNKHEHEHSSDVPQRLADLRLEAHRLKALKQAAERQLEALTQAAESARKWQALQREIDQLNERVLLRVKRLEEVEMETEEAQLLLKQVEDAMKQPAEPAEADE